MKGDEFLLVKEVAARLRVAPNTVRAWAASGKLTEYRHPVNNYRLFKRADVEALLRKIEAVCRALPVPVLVKEVGWGLSPRVARPSRGLADRGGQCGIVEGHHLGGRRTVPDLEERPRNP